MQEETLSFTIVEDGDEAIGNFLNIRAVISERSELQELIEKLTRRLETDFAQEDDNARTRIESVHSGEPADHIFRDAGR